MAKKCENPECNKDVIDSRQILSSHQAWGKILCMECQIKANEGTLVFEDGNEPEQENVKVLEMDVLPPDEPKTNWKEEPKRMHEKLSMLQKPRTMTAHANMYTEDQITTIKNTVARGATDDELAMFLHVCQTYALDPFLKEIFYSAKMQTIITSRDGYLKVAQRDPEFDGIQSMAVCENDEFSIDMVNNVVNHKFGKGARGQVIGAWAVCYRKGRRPVIAYADYEEYKKDNPIWKTYKSAMYCKVAESFSLKRQYGISGLVTQEEIGVEA